MSGQLPTGFKARAVALGLRPPDPERPAAPSGNVVQLHGSLGDTPYGLKALTGICQQILDAGTLGHRDDTFNAACVRAGTLIRDGKLTKGTAETELRAAGLAVTDPSDFTAYKVEEKLGRVIEQGINGNFQIAYGPDPTDLPPLRDFIPIKPPADEAPPAEATDGESVDPTIRQPNPLPALDLALLAEPCPDPEWLVEGRMTRNSLTLLGAKPGIGKSWTALDLALALTTGRDWLGHKVPQKARVLYIDVENGEVLARRRLQQLGADPALIGDRLHYVTESVIFPGGEDSRRYADTLAAFQPDLVVVDTLASAAPSAESDTESMSLFLYDIWHRARASGAAVLVLAHLRKSQQGAGKDDPLDSFRGAGHLAGAASRAWLLEPRGAEKFVLRDVKTREFTACPPTRVALQDTELPPGGITAKRTAVVVDGVEDEDSPESGLIRFQTNVLTMIDNHPTGEAKAADLLAVGTGESDKTLRHYLGEMVASGVLRRVRKGFYARGTDTPFDSPQEA